MERLKDYLIYNYNNIDVPSLFDNLSKQLKVLHSYDKVVPNLNSETILRDEQGYSFYGMSDSNNLDGDKRKNLVSLAKAMLGIYLIANEEYDDFSSLDDSWFAQRIDTICATISSTDESFDGEYFINLFNGSNEYYCDYLDRMEQNQELAGKGNVRAYRKVLSNAASEFYQDQSLEPEIDPEKKTASISSIFYPLLIGLSVLVGISIMLVAKFV